MKTGKTLLITVVLLLSFDLSKAQETNYPETVIIKTFESITNMGVGEEDTKMIIIGPDNKVETKTLELANMRKDGYHAVISANQIKIKNEIQRWRNAGFTIKSSHAVSIGAFIMTDYLLEKN